MLSLGEAQLVFFIFDKLLLLLFLLVRDWFEFSGEQTASAGEIEVIRIAHK